MLRVQIGVKTLTDIVDIVSSEEDVSGGAVDGDLARKGVLKTATILLRILLKFKYGLAHGRALCFYSRWL